jgi:hypothetical protein
VGLGRYHDGKFDLVLSLRHNADAARIEEWERSFRHASEILYDATDGQMQFGRVFVANNSRGTAEADGFLMEAEGTSFTTPPIPGLGTDGLHVVLMGDERRKPFIVIHEFAHYAFGVWDEYEDPTQCTNDTSTNACVMEWGWSQGDQLTADGTLIPGVISKFCTPDNHDPDGGTEQEAMNGESCWETLVDNYPDVTMPMGLPGGPEPGGHEDIDWVVLADVSRFSLVLDRSGSMSTGNAIAGVRYGADYWVRYLAQTGDELSVVKYNHTATDILDNMLLTGATDLDPTLDGIAAITASGTTNIGGALQRGMDQILSPGSQAATQVLILFSDGLHNTGTNPATVLPVLVENGIRVYTIGFGPGADQALLQTIAEETGGRFEQIDAAPDSADAQLEIQNYLIEVSGVVRDGSGIVTMVPGLLDEPPEAMVEEASKISALRYSKADLEKIKARPFHFRARPLGVDHRAFIEAGSKQATFVVSHLIGTEVTLHLVRPDGSIVDPAADPSVSLVDPKGIPYTFYVVKKPMPGMWVMRVSRAQRRKPIPYKVFAFSDNPTLRLALKGARTIIPAPGIVALGIVPTGFGALVGTRTPAVTTFGAIGTGKMRRPFRIDVTEGVKAPARCHGRQPRGPAGFTANITLDWPGSFPVEVQLVNPGKAREVATLRERPESGDPLPKIPDPSAFQRIRRVQLHVGPLPKGVDLEAKNRPPKRSRGPQRRAQ